MTTEEALVLFRKIVDETGEVLAICPDTLVNSWGEFQVWDIIDLSSKDLYGDNAEEYLLASDPELSVAIEKAAKALEFDYLVGG